MSNKKITLITLPSPFLDEPGLHPLLGISYISSYLKYHNYHNVNLVDYNILKYDYFNNSDYLKEIPLDSDFYGIHCMTPQYKWLYEVCKYIRVNNNKCKIITGGPHSSNCPEDCLIDCGADVAVIGEGEEVFLDIIKDVPLNKIRGAAHLYKGKVINSERAYIKNLDSLPFPDRNLNDINKYTRTIDGNRAFHIVTLRGCPYSCYFCDRFSVGRNVRYRSVENVFKEIDKIYDEYNVNSFVIYDDIFTLNTKRVKKFCDGFKKRNITWRIWSRSNTLDREKLSYMKNSGLTQITIGIESFDNRMLKNMGKGTTSEQNKKALLLCKEFGIKAQCSLMYGNPGENRESIDNTIRYVKEIQPDNWDITVLSPIPGSSFWNFPEKYGIKINKKFVKDNFYMPCARTGSESGVTDIWIELDSMTNQEFIDNLKYFLERLDEVSPRAKIWKHYQNIKTNKVRYY